MDSLSLFSRTQMRITLQLASGPEHFSQLHELKFVSVHKSDWEGHKLTEQLRYFSQDRIITCSPLHDPMFLRLLYSKTAVKIDNQCENAQQNLPCCCCYTIATSVYLIKSARIFTSRTLLQTQVCENWP